MNDNLELTFEVISCMFGAAYFGLAFIVSRVRKEWVRQEAEIKRRLSQSESGRVYTVGQLSQLVE